MRIVSLVPGATEIVCALDLGASLVGVSHECDHPPEVRSKPRLTRSRFDSSRLPSGEIDRAVRSAPRGGLYEIDATRLRSLRPDLVIAQAVCGVCAVSTDEVRAAIAGLRPEPTVLSLDPARFEEVLGDVGRIAEATGVSDRGAEVLARLRHRIEGVVERTKDRGRPPRVVCLEWLDPFFVAGHWVPEMVEMAGGRDVLGRPGEPSRPVSWPEVVHAAPESLLLIPCGFGTERTSREAARLRGLPGFADLPAVRRGSIWALDGNAYFSRPGPRVVAGVEILALLLHPAPHFALPPGSAARVAL